MRNHSYVLYGLLSNILIWYIICIVQNACRTRVYVCLDFYFLFEIGLKKLTSKLPMLQYYTCAFSMFHFNFSSKHFTTLYFFSIFRFSLLWRSFVFFCPEESSNWNFMGCVKFFFILCSTILIFIEDINLFIFCSKISQQRTPGNRNNALGKRRKKRREEV